MFPANQSSTTTSTSTLLDEGTHWAEYVILPVAIFLLAKYRCFSLKVILKWAGLMLGDFLLFIGGYLIKENILICIVLCIIMWTTLELTCYCHRSRQETNQNQERDQSGELIASGVNLGQDPIHVSANDCFSDLTVSFEKCFMVFAAQTLLMQYYCKSAVDKMSAMVAPGSLDVAKWRYFASAVFIQQFVLSQSDESFPMDIWKKLFGSSGTVKSSVEVTARRAEWVQRGLLEVCVRFFMALAVKKFYSQMIIITLPVVLSDASTGLDFVKDAFAVTFVATMDAKEGHLLEVDMGVAESLPSAHPSAPSFELESVARARDIVSSQQP